MALLKKKSTEQLAEDADQGPVRHEWPSPVKPSALLVPRYVIDNNAAAKTRRIAVLGVGGVALLAALSVAFVFLAAITTKTELTEAEGARDSAQVNVDRLAPISSYYDGLEERKQATLSLLTNDIAHAKLLNEFRRAMPAGAEFSSYAPVIGVPCPGPDPFATSSSLGCITVAVTARDEGQVASIISNVESSDAGLLSDPFVTGLSKNPATPGEPAEVSFSLSVNFSVAAYSGKYMPSPSAEPGTPGAPTDQTQGGTP